MTDTALKPLEQIAAYATELLTIQERIKTLNAELKYLTSQKEQVADLIAMEMKDIAGEDDITKGLILDGVGVVKLDTKPYPRVIDVESFVKWGREVNQMLPPLTVNATTLSAWFAEQNKLNLPLPPEDICPVFWKTSIRVNKR